MLYNLFRFKKTLDCWKERVSTFYIIKAIHHQFYFGNIHHSKFSLTCKKILFYNLFFKPTKQIFRAGRHLVESIEKKTIGELPMRHLSGQRSYQYYWICLAAHFYIGRCDGFVLIAEKSSTNSEPSQVFPRNLRQRTNQSIPNKP